MPRPKNPTPSYLLHQKTGQARVRLKIGTRYQDIYLGKYGSPESLEKYHRVLAEHFGAKGNGQEPSLSTTHEDQWTVAALAVEYDDFASTHYVKNGEPTDDRYRAAIPNVVLIYIDDLGYGDLGAYGCTDIPTPNIDRLAEEGVRCTASYIVNPPCCPSRCSLMMGQYGQRFGKYGMSRGLPIPEDRPTLAKFLQDHGYVTGQIGKWDIGTRRQGPLNSGFMEVARIPPPKQYTEEELASVSESLKRQLASKEGKSKYFCLNEDGETVWLTDYDGDCMVDFIDRHKAEPFLLYWSPNAVHSFNTEVPDRLANRTQAEGTRRKLAGAIVSVDDQVGKLLQTLGLHGLRNRTLVIFSSDNGANSSEGGSSTPYAGGKGQGTQKEGWVRVPTILSMTGVLPEGKTYDGLMANLDFYSTIPGLHLC